MKDLTFISKVKLIVYFMGELLIWAISLDALKKLIFAMTGSNEGQLLAYVYLGYSLVYLVILLNISGEIEKKLSLVNKRREDENS